VEEVRLEEDDGRGKEVGDRGRQIGAHTRAELEAEPDCGSVGSVGEDFLRNLTFVGGQFKAEESHFLTDHDDANKK
jgi:hypothetical protein